MKKKKEETKGLDVDGLFDYQDFEREAISGLLSGKSLLGSEGVLTAMVQRLVNLALKGEMRVHVESEKDKGIIDRLNGHVSKGLQTDLGEFEIKTPRDRNGSFEPQLVGKWERHLGSGVEQQLLSLYASIGDIQHRYVNLLHRHVNDTPSPLRHTAVRLYPPNPIRLTPSIPIKKYLHSKKYPRI